MNKKRLFDVKRRLGLSANPLLALAETLALRADVVSQHRPEDEILLGRKLAKWFRDYHADSVQALALAKEEVQAVVAHGLDDVFDVLALQSRPGESLILLVESEEHHPAHTFLILIDMIHQYFQVDWRCYFLLHTIRY